ncbi:MAG: hypothetical protein GX495_10895 [Chloroflexi bacterium]|nr:hypothetical protein [Chloroflexota bacterium]
MKDLHFQTRSVPVALLLLCLLTFGLLTPWLGFYWDDWPSIWYLHLFGPGGYPDVYAIDRPLLGRLFMLTTPIFGEHTFSWQLFGLAARWFTSLAMWWTLRQIWPQRPRMAVVAALLFLIYPGFQQQFIAVTYSHVFLLLTFFLLSLGLMAAAFRQGDVPERSFSWPRYLLSIALASVTIFTVEYFFGLEFLRPVLLWLVLRDREPDRSRRLRAALAAWLPYLAVLGVFLVWRLFIQETARGRVQLHEFFDSGFLPGLLEFGRMAAADVFQAALQAWALIWPGYWLQGTSTAFKILAILAALAALGLTGLYFWFLRSGDQPGTSARRPWAWEAMGLGTLSLFLGGIPFWVTRLPIELYFPWDRFTLAFMFGASLLLAGLLELVLRSRRALTAVLAVITALAVGFHVNLANRYRMDWNIQKDFFWQMTWRMPGLDPQTTLLSAELPFAYFSDNSLTAPLNWTYAPENNSREMPYLFYTIDARLGIRLEDLKKDLDIYQPYRATSFSGSTSQALLVYYFPPACFKVVDPRTDARIPQKPRFMGEALELSNLDVIQTQADPPARPPESIVGSEPEHNWCYYYQKADLARQMQDWQQVAALGDQAIDSPGIDPPVVGHELTPFIEGYAHTGRWDQAYELTLRANRLTGRMVRHLCTTWDRIADETPADEERDRYLEKVNQELGCEF